MSVSNLTIFKWDIPFLKKDGYIAIVTCMVLPLLTDFLGLNEVLKTKCEYKLGFPRVKCEHILFGHICCLCKKNYDLKSNKNNN